MPVRFAYPTVSEMMLGRGYEAKLKGNWREVGICAEECTRGLDGRELCAVGVSLVCVCVCVSRRGIRRNNSSLVLLPRPLLDLCVTYYLPLLLAYSLLVEG